MTRAQPWSRVASDRKVIAPDQAWAAEKVASLRAGCHGPGRDLFDDTSDWIAAIVGRSGGKTTHVIGRAARTLVTVPQGEVVFIAATREVAELLVWNKMLAVLDRLGIEYEPKYAKLWIIIKRTKARLRLVGADDKKEINKLRGVPFDEVIIDEAAAMNQPLLEELIDQVVGPRLRGPLVMISTPARVLSGIFFDATSDKSTKSRLYKDRNKPELADRKWSRHFWTLADPGVQKLPVMREAWRRALKTKEDNGWSDEHPIWRREYLGEWAADQTGNVFQYSTSKNQWDPPMKGPKYGEAQFAVLPDLSDEIDKWKPDWEYIIAMDQGHADPFAVDAFALSPTDPKRRIWHVYGFGRVKFFANLVAKLMLGEELNAEKPAGILAHTGWPAAHVWDADQAHIDELATVYGIRTTKADRKPEYKFGAVELVNGDLVDGRIFVLKGSGLEEQLLSLQWKVNDLGQLKEDPAQRNDHTDCLIYARLEIANLFNSGKVGATSPPAYRDPMGLDDGDAADPADGLWTGDGNDDGLWDT